MRKLFVKVWIYTLFEDNDSHLLIKKYFFFTVIYRY